MNIKPRTGRRNYQKGGVVENQNPWDYPMRQHDSGPWTYDPRSSKILNPQLPNSERSIDRMVRDPHWHLEKSEEKT